MSKKDTIESLLTPAVRTTFRNNYSGVELIATEDDVEVSGIPKEDIIRARLDLNIYFHNPKLPLENICNRLDTYRPRNKSQKQLLNWANKLLALETTTSAGLFAHGSPGTGKTHISVALAKEFLLKGQEVHYISPESYGNISLRPCQVWIVDDLNSPYSPFMDLFKKIVMNTHNSGGLIFATSNAPYEPLIKKSFIGTDADARRLRYTDRTKTLFKELKLLGRSNRAKTAWHAQD